MRGWTNSAGKRIAPVSAAAALCLLLAHCSDSRKIDPRYGVAASPRVVEPGEPVPKGGGTYRVGAPYLVAGRLYVPEEDPHYRAEGLASWYGENFHGRQTANGEVFDLDAISAAHPTLPLPCYARVTNLANGRSLIVRVNDRGPYHGSRIIDVSVRAAHLLGFHERGTARVRVEYVGRAPLEGSDDRLLAATLRQDGPAPPPDRIKLAAIPIVPAKYKSRHAPASMPTRMASASPGVTASLPGLARTAAYSGPNGLDGTDQFLNGRGLY